MIWDSPFRNFSYLLAGRITSKVFSSIFYFLFAFILFPEGFGQLVYIMALASTFAIFSRPGLNYTVEYYQAKGNSFISNQINVLVLVTTSIATVILLFINPLAALLPLATSFFEMNEFNLLGKKNYKKIFYFIVTRSVLVVSITVFLFGFLEIGGIIIGLSLAHLFGALYFLKTLNVKVFSFQPIKKIFKQIIHNFGFDASFFLPKIIDKLVILPVLGLFSLGIYQFNLLVLFSLELLPFALHSFLLSEETSGKSHKALSFLVVVASVLVAILAYFVSPFFVNEIFPSYSEGIPSLQVMIISLVPLSISVIYAAKLQAKQSTKIGYSAILRIGSLLSLIVLLGDLYGLVGLSLAVLISTILNTIFLFVLYHKTKNSTFSP